MLQTQAVDPPLLELLTKLMSVPAFEGFVLVGGTALALQEGHRKSIDIDLFGNVSLVEIELTDALKTVGKVNVLSKSKSILVYRVDGIKVDVVDYHYKWIEGPLTVQGIRLASKKDIAAMKLNAIAGRGTKKDFVDFFELLKQYSLKEMLKFYTDKYPDGSAFLVMKSLSYFDDADNEEPPFMLAPFDWDLVKKEIRRQVKEYGSK